MYDDLKKRISFDNYVIETPNGDVSKKDDKYKSLIELGFKPINKPSMNGIGIHITRKDNVYDYQTHFNGKHCKMAIDDFVDLSKKLNVKTFVYDEELNDNGWSSNGYGLKTILHWSKLIKQYGEVFIICKDTFTGCIITRSINFVNNMLTSDISSGLLHRFVDGLFDICKGVSYYGHPIDIIMDAFKDDILYKFKNIHITVKGEYPITIRVDSVIYCDGGNHPYHLKFNGKRVGKEYNEDIRVYRSNEDRILKEYLDVNMSSDSLYQKLFDAETTNRINTEKDRITALKISDNIIAEGLRALNEVQKLANNKV